MGRPSGWANVPNLITLARICAVPLILWLVLRELYLAAFWTFVAAGVSDALDGFIAKRYGAESLVGGFLDPIADKALLVTVFLALGYIGMLPGWLVILVVFRDILIVAGAVLVETLTRNLTMAPLMVSKVNTTVQIVLASLVLGGLGFDLSLDSVIGVMIYAVAATTFLSGAAYVITWTRRAGKLGRGDTEGEG